MSETETPPSDAVTHKIKVSEAYKDTALEKVRAMVRGNQFDPDDVVIESFDGEVLHFQAETVLEVYTKVTEKTVPGQVTTAIRVKDDVAAKEEMAKAYALIGESPDMARRIRKAVTERDDQGFALDKEVISLAFGQKEFVIFDPCQTCKATGTVTCMKCHGKGYEVCPRCSGSGMESCRHCNGAGTVPGPNGQNIPCPVCHGQGRVSCSLCQQQGRISCKTCAGRGVTTCPNCDGHAWISRLFIQELNIRTAFDYPKARLPDKIVAMIDKHGAKIREHAEIKISDVAQSSVNVDDAEKQKQAEMAEKRHDIRLPVVYEVVLPYGHVEYGIGGKSYYTFLFGTQGRLTHVSPFLDDLVKEGVRKLKNAMDGRGDVVRNIVEACEYRTLKEGVYYAARYSVGKARQMLKKSNRLGLSDVMNERIIKTADAALKNITKKPRYMGLGYAFVVQALLTCGYFLTPVRAMFLRFIPNINMHQYLDIGIIFACMMLGVVLIQYCAQSAMNRVMSRIMEGNNVRLPMPKLGEVGYIHAGLSFIVMIGVLEYLRLFGGGPVSWYNMLIEQLLARLI